MAKGENWRSEEGRGEGRNTMQNRREKIERAEGGGRRRKAQWTAELIDCLKLATGETPPDRCKMVRSDRHALSKWRIHLILHRRAVDIGRRPLLPG